MKRSLATDYLKSIGNSQSLSKRIRNVKSYNYKPNALDFESSLGSTVNQNDDEDLTFHWPKFELMIDDQPNTSSGTLIFQRKVNQAQRQRRSSPMSTMNIISKYDPSKFEPTTSEQLAVSSKKIAELSSWIKKSTEVKCTSKILLLTGPSGSGKSTAVKVLCKEIGVEFFEFDGSQCYHFSLNYDDFPESAIKEFFSFLKNSNFSSCKGTMQHRLLLFDQLPTSFYRDKSLLRRCLIDIGANHNRCTVVFAFSNSDSCWELNPVKIFPSALLESLNIKHIKFNAASKTLISKAIKKILESFRNKVDANFIRQTIDYAEGDIRKAINFIHFSFNSLKNTFVLPGGLGNLEHFHFLGKVMYSKRLEQSTSTWNRCEARLNRILRPKFSRPSPPKDDLNQLISQCFLSGSCLTAYVFEHQPNFSPSLRALKRTSCSIAYCDELLNSFEHYELADRYRLESTIRAAFFNNYCHTPKQAKRSGLYEFTKARFKIVEERCRETHFSISQLFPLERSTILKTLILPSLLSINPLCENHSQMQLFQRLSFSNNKFSLKRHHEKQPNPSYPVYEILDGTLSSSAPISLESTSTNDFDDGFSYEIDDE